MYAFIYIYDMRYIDLGGVFTILSHGWFTMVLTKLHALFLSSLVITHERLFVLAECLLDKHWDKPILKSTALCLVVCPLGLYFAET